MYCKSFSLLTVFMLLAGCGGSVISAENYTVKIVRSVAGVSDPSLLIAADSATFDYEKRVVSIKGVNNIAGDRVKNGWVVNRDGIQWQQGNMTIQLPSDAPYQIYIGKIYFLLPAVSVLK